MNDKVLPPRTVLVVDDEEHVRTALTRLLRDAGYTVFAAESGEEALLMLRDHPVKLLISDNNMPGISGMELFKEVRRHWPHLLRIMLTGDTDPELAVRSINEAEVYRFIRKPWNNADLRTIVRLAFEVSVLEDEKRKLLEIVRSHRARRSLGEPTPDAEAELLLLAEADLLDT
jgi:two-component system, probable response regulator PhcQ